MPKSYRHTRAARQAGNPAPEKALYEIIDPNHKPDLNGELAGAKVQLENGKQRVALTAAQARFYLDQGVLRRLDDNKPKAKKPEAAKPSAAPPPTRKTM
jgi:hypothetical protein